MIEKPQAPNSKFQKSSKLQIPIRSGVQTSVVWVLELEVSLGFGVWSLELMPKLS